MSVDIEPGIYCCTTNPKNTITIDSVDPKSLLEMGVLYEIVLQSMKLECPYKLEGCPANCTLGKLYNLVKQNHDELARRVG